MPPNPTTAASRVMRARSTKSDDSYIAAASHTKPPTVHRPSTRAVRATSALSDTPSHAEPHWPGIKAPQVAEHYSLPPTVPSPFSGTLEASLDGILQWGSLYADTQPVVDALLRPVDANTIWPNLIGQMMFHGDHPPGRGRYLVEELLFLATRTLFPEQILENRRALGRLYDRKKQLAIRLMLRYDMLRGWKMDSSHHALTVASVAPANGPAPLPIPTARPLMFPNRRVLMPNIFATLVAAPPGGFTTHGVRERMKHHVTDLDEFLLLTDQKVASWNVTMLISMTSQVVLLWQWLRRHNDILLEMEAHGWEELDGRADECEWIADDVKRLAAGKKDGNRRCRAGDADDDDDDDDDDDGDTKILLKSMGR